MLKRIILTFIALAFLAGFPASAQVSTCVKYDDVAGAGQYPFNFRIIDNKLMAGGYLFNPIGRGNSKHKVHSYIKTLRELGASSIILLHVPANGDVFTRSLEQLCELEKIELLKMRMNSAQVPNEAETQKILNAIDDGAYVHCMWGCDRTGAIIAKYLIGKAGYSPAKAFAAIIGGGSHSGKRGGFKIIPGNRNLLVYFWPTVASDSPEIWQNYQEKKSD